MRKRIFGSICVASFITLLLTATFIIDVLYTNSSKDLQNEVKLEASYIAEAINMGQTEESYVSAVGKTSTNRITLIRADGTVSYDNFASTDSMDNHLNRPEVISALENGTGEQTRLSDTIGEQTYYYAVTLDNGDVLRIANTAKSVFGLIGNAIVWVIVISVFVLIIAVVIAHFLSNRILKPMNNLDLDQPLSNVTYEELSPLLTRMQKQNEKIARQMESLSEQQKEFDYITGNMKEGLVIIGDNGTVLSANESAKRIFGSADTTSYLTISRDENYIAAVKSALSGTSTSHKMAKNGRIYQLSASPVQGQIEGYSAVLFAVDITDHEQSEQMRREFSANVSHELKTPLTSIMGCSEIIGNGIAKPEDIPHFAEQIHSEAARLLLLIEDIIKLSRLDEAELINQFEPVSLLDICKTVVNELTDKAKKADVNLNFSGEKILLNGYKPVLHEMIYNLCDNAITYNKPKGTVTITLEKRGGKAVITVIDTGIGIPVEHQNRVFERFYRVDKSHSKETGGTGLGLSIVKHGAMLHNADLALKSNVGEGTEIKVSFKL